MNNLLPLLKAIAAGDDAVGLTPDLAHAALQEGASRQVSTAFYLPELFRHLYEGDTALHLAAAAYRPELAERLIGLGADVEARNRMGATPLHDAAMGAPGGPRWNPQAQAATIALLIKAGADPNGLDKQGVAPLHRAVRTRCAAAVEALLKGGADARLKNRKGSTPMLLATQMTGRGGSSSLEAKAQQALIIALLEG